MVTDYAALKLVIITAFLQRMLTHLRLTPFKWEVCNRIDINSII